MEDLVADPSGKAAEYDFSPKAVDYDDLPHMPPEYREQLIRLMSIQAYSELKAATEGIRWIANAPDFRRRRLFTKILSEEASHSYLIYGILERVGVSEAEAVAIAEGRKGSRMHEASLEGPLSVGHPNNEWIDIMLNHLFLDRAGKFMVSNYTQASFRPWADANEIILAEEAAHIGFGFVEMREWLTHQVDPEKTRRRVASWYARGLNFFGPPSTRKSRMLREYGLKRLDNEGLRNAYRQEVEQVFAELGRPELIMLEAHEFPYR
jgi:ring-1,2-phenylacetyl-CoA epoxidase subunit PaaA